ncbi:MAG: hypothetical protein ABI923_02150 [bacterium]
MSTVIVFSHPNHELAVFGLLQRLSPFLVYLTDGGGTNRLAQTRQGLEGIGLLGKALFLNHTEKSFYDSLLACDAEFFEGISEEVRASFQAIRPERILCDAVEFYNPVHDLTLPVVRAALRGHLDRPVFEVPLVYQRPGEGESYAVQRLPASRRTGQIAVRLSEEELDAKISARDQIYTILADQMGPVLSELPRAHVGLEYVAPARAGVPEPGPDVALRYERRAQILADSGKIDHKITYELHFLPVASSLLRSLER